MRKLIPAAACGLAFALIVARHASAAQLRDGTCVDSPRAVLTVCVAADARGPFYEVSRGGHVVIAKARLGLVLDGFGNAPASSSGCATR